MNFVGVVFGGVVVFVFIVFVFEGNGVGGVGDTVIFGVGGAFVHSYFFFVSFLLLTVMLFVL